MFRDVEQVGRKEVGKRQERRRAFLKGHNDFSIYLFIGFFCCADDFFSYFYFFRLIFYRNSRQIFLCFFFVFLLLNFFFVTFSSFFSSFSFNWQIKAIINKLLIQFNGEFSEGKTRCSLRPWQPMGHGSHVPSWRQPRQPPPTLPPWPIIPAHHTWPGSEGHRIHQYPISNVKPIVELIFPWRNLVVLVTGRTWRSARLVFAAL